MALKSPVSTHSFWGSYSTFSALPASATVEVGDTAFVTGTQEMYVCTSVSPSVVWSPLALRDATRIIHSQGITPAIATTIPGQSPEAVIFGTPPTVVGLHYKRDDDKVYGYQKIQTSYVSDASFHIHWTKNVDTNQAGAKVRWVLTYTVFDVGSNVNAPVTNTITWDDTYDDPGTTTRIVYRTPNASAPEFTAGYYVSFALGFDPNPLYTTLSGRPVVISCDVLSRNTINLGN